MTYYYVVTYESGYFNWRVTMSAGDELMPGSIAEEEGVLLFNWKQISRMQCVDLLGEETTKEFEEILLNPKINSTNWDSTKKQLKLIKED